MGFLGYIGFIVVIAILFVVVQAVKEFAFRNKVLWGIYQAVTIAFLCALGSLIAIAIVVRVFNVFPEAPKSHFMTYWAAVFIFTKVAHWLLAEPKEPWLLDELKTINLTSEADTTEAYTTKCLIEPEAPWRFEGLKALNFISKTDNPERQS